MSRLKQKCGVSRVAFFYLKRGHGEITGKSHLRHQPDRSCRQCRSISNEGIWITSRVVLKNPAYAKYNASWSPISSEMKLKTSANASEETRSYTQLQQQIHDALRVQHPEWVEPNGDCPTCESYESRLAELLRLSSSSEYRSAA